MGRTEVSTLFAARYLCIVIAYPKFSKVLGSASERKLIKGLHEPSLEYGITVSGSLPKNMTSNRVSSVDPANKSPF